MTFVSLGNTRGRTAVSQRVTCQNRGGSMIVRLAGDVSERSGLIRGVRVEPMIGVGEDEGLVMIRPGKMGGIVRQRLASKMVEFCLPAKRLGIRAPDKTTEVAFGWRGDNLVLDLSSLPAATEQPHARQDEAARPVPVG